ncbi:tetratricopeptide repeat protein [Aureispira anguillae]|uniref:Oxygen sensor histidine kinase NreB n=2 Tax=Aureispira anguillae TaxID=2864201 RepID=A0A915YGX5_9BACT|nr:tetratricopeptide repeat protein [Aureispira anguillae]
MMTMENLNQWIRAKSLSILLLFIGLSNGMVAQQLDSLKHQLSLKTKPSEKAVLYNEIAWAALLEKKDSVVFYAEEALAFSKQHQLQEPLIVATLQMANIYRKKKQLDLAAQHLEQAQLLLQEGAFPEQQTRYRLFSAYLALSNRNLEKAIEQFQKGYTLSFEHNPKLQFSFCMGLGYAYQKQGAYEKAEEYLKKGLEVAKTTHNWEDKIKAYNDLGNFYARQERYDEALLLYKGSLELCEQHQDYKGQSRVYLNMGNIHLLKEHWTLAIEYYMQSAALKEQLEDRAGAAAIHNNIAAIYKEQKRYTESLEYYEKSRVHYNDIQDSVGLAETWINIAIIKVLQKEPQMAIVLLNKALNVLEQRNEQAAIAIAQLNLAFAYSEVGEYQLALDYLQFAEKVAKEKEDLHSMVSIANAYGANYFYLKNYPKAIQYYQEGLKIGQDLELLVEQRTALFGLYETKQYMGDFEASLKWFEQYTIIKDSLVNNRNNHQLVSLQEQYHTKQKEQEIAQLNIVNDNIELENQLKTKQFNLLLLGSLLILVIMGLLSLFLYYRQQQQKIVLKHATELHNKQINQLIQEQEIETLDVVFAAQQKERKSLAKDIHDTLGSFLATLKYQHEAGRPQTEEKAVQNQYQIMEQLIGQACTEVRSISHQMATGERFNFDLKKAIENLVQRIRNTQQFKVDFNYFGEHFSLPNETELTLYRIVQELFSNILKHAQASHAILQINQSESEITLMMEDDGQGFDVQHVASGGLGLNSISERVQKLKGAVQVDSHKGRGTTVVISLPSMISNP